MPEPIDDAVFGRMTWDESMTYWVGRFEWTAGTGVDALLYLPDNDPERGLTDAKQSLEWLRDHEPEVRRLIAAEVAEWWNMLEFPAVISVDDVVQKITLDEVRFEDEGGLGIYYLDTGLSGKSFFAAWYGPDREYQGCTQDSP